MSHIKTLLCQSHFFRLEEFELLDTTWKSYMLNFPRNTVKFLLNSVLDTLPTNSNLMRWGKRSNSKCELCSHHDTLLHTLNNCPTMLKDGRYTWIHNSVLSHMFILAQNQSKETGWIIHSDLPGHNNKCDISTVPTDICVTTQIPNIVMINRPHKIAILIELTVCFETNFEKSAQRKENRYGSLLNDIQSTPFTCELITIVVGSRGLVSVDNRSKLTTIYSRLNGSKKTSH